MQAAPSQSLDKAFERTPCKSARLFRYIPSVNLEQSQSVAISRLGFTPLDLLPANCPQLWLISDIAMNWTADPLSDPSLNGSGTYNQTVGYPSGSSTETILTSNGGTDGRTGTVSGFLSPPGADIIGANLGFGIVGTFLHQIPYSYFSLQVDQFDLVSVSNTTATYNIHFFLAPGPWHGGGTATYTLSNPVPIIPASPFDESWEQYVQIGQQQLDALSLSVVPPVFQGGTWNPWQTFISTTLASRGFANATPPLSQFLMKKSLLAAHSPIKSYTYTVLDKDTGLTTVKPLPVTLPLGTGLFVFDPDGLTTAPRGWTVVNLNPLNTDINGPVYWNLDFSF
jgi:hypothetical protein